jgi:hypothetical protein
MLVEVSGASLILTCSADLDEDTIPEDISLPIDVSELTLCTNCLPGCAKRLIVPLTLASVQLWGLLTTSAPAIMMQRSICHGCSVLFPCLPAGAAGPH